MTDRVNSLTVALEKDMRDDDIECLIQAIRLFKGVLTVGTNISDSNTYVAEQRCNKNMRQALYNIIDNLK